MRGKIKTARRKSSKLHGATAQYVSLVDAGANETPFTIIKSANGNGASAMSIKKRGNKTRTKKSHKPLSSAKKNEGTVETRVETMIAKMVFSVDLFDTEQEVRDYIQAAEWEADVITITKNDDGDWEARSGDLTDDDFDKIGKVDTDEEGVEAWVGKRTVEVETEASTETKDTTDDADDADEDDEDDEDEDTEEVEAAMDDKKKKPVKKVVKLSKRAEFLKKRKETSTVKKFDAWDAYFSKANTLAKALSDGMAYDHTPPGYYEVQAAFNAVVSNIVSDGDLGGAKQEALNKVAADYAEIIGGLDTFFDAYVEADEETVAKTVTDADERKAVAKWADSYGDFVTGEAAPAKVSKTTKAPVTIENSTTTIDYSKIGETIAGIVAKSLEPVIEQVEGVAETVDALATRAPSKKAAEPEDTGSAGPRRVKTKSSDSIDDSSVGLEIWRKDTASKAIFG